MDHDHHNMMSTVASTGITSHDHNNHGHVHPTTAIGEDHSAHGAGAMNHGAAGGMNHGSDAGMMMMVMHVGFKEVVVFPFWQTQSVGSLVGSCFALAFIAILYEALKLLRDRLTDSRLLKNKITRQMMVNGASNNNVKHCGVNKVSEFSMNEAAESSATSNSMANSKSELSIRGPVRRFLVRRRPERYLNKMLSVDHLVQTALHVLQFAIGYFLMLAFMTYNYWLCLSILIGIGIGFFLFGLRRSRVDINEDCCH